ncbi:MAG: hypothetical protein IK051_09245 [Rhodocyclaceae bacterium]|nr:hypothetical protein [Rhodocyclaceae bacterium]
MESKTVTIGTMQFAIPEYFQQVDSTPDAPPQSVPFMTKSENALCLVIAYPIPPEFSMPLDSEVLASLMYDEIDKNQGLIQVGAGKDHVFGIVKALKPEGGIQYILALERHYDEDTILRIQGFFDEEGITGLRDTTVYELCRREGTVGSEDDPFCGWREELYDDSYAVEAQKNLSEEEKYDEMFPAHPLSMCRAFVRTVTSS